MGDRERENEGREATEGGEGWRGWREGRAGEEDVYRNEMPKKDTMSTIDIATCLDLSLLLEPRSLDSRIDACAPMHEVEG